ncbi:MAG: hypothetical protein K2X27_16135, partial [Candidatus Obscuribacterales bacterium]|nr:hypothetical protein [Candidatus Obscuribacterales bacterium]
GRPRDYAGLIPAGRQVVAPCVTLLQQSFLSETEDKHSLGPEFNGTATQTGPSNPYASQDRRPEIDYNRTVSLKTGIARP